MLEFTFVGFTVTVYLVISFLLCSSNGHVSLLPLLLLVYENG